MKKVLVGMLIGLGLVGLGIAMSFVEESKEVEGISTVPCQEVGYVYEETMPEHLCVGCVEELEEMIWDIYVEEYCVNECDECDSYYYKECMCDSCEDGNDCYECLQADYEIFIEDYYDMIMDMADEMLIQEQDAFMYRANELVYYEF